MGYTVAVMGATGNVGRELLSILAEREFPVEEVIALASSRSVGREVSFGEDDVLKVENLDAVVTYVQNDSMLGSRPHRTSFRLSHSPLGVAT